MLLSVSGLLVTAADGDCCRSPSVLQPPTEPGPAPPKLEGQRQHAAVGGKTRDALARLRVALAQHGCLAVHLSQRYDSGSTLQLHAVSRRGTAASVGCGSSGCLEVQRDGRLCELSGGVTGKVAAVCFTDQWVVLVSGTRLVCAPHPSSERRDREPRDGRWCTVPDSVCSCVAAESKRVCVLQRAVCCVAVLPDPSGVASPVLAATIDLAPFGAKAGLAAAWPQSKPGRLVILCTGAAAHADPTAAQGGASVIGLTADVSGHGGGAEVAGRHTVSESESEPTCSAASPCGRMLLLGTADGTLLCHNHDSRRLYRAERLRDAVRVVAACFSGPFVLASLSTASLRVYDLALSPFRVVLQGGSAPSLSLPLPRLTGVESPAAVLHGAGSVCAVGAVEGPACVLELHGPCTAAAIASGHGRAGSDGAVGFIAQAPRAEQLGLVSAAAAAAYAAGHTPLLAKLLQAFAPSYRDGADQVAFAAIFRRYFDQAVYCGYHRSAFSTARALGSAALFSELHSAARGAAPSVAEAALERGTAAAREDEAQRALLQHWESLSAGSAGFRLADLESLQRWEKEGAVPLAAAPRLVRLLGLYSGRQAAEAAAGRYASLATADGDTAAAEAILAEVPKD